ncbi:MAG TPA: WHG domain-containing protein [Phototrophicaceae bacterium]|jgi:AcrR family transcriptional regulator|nr:WHG domain-containing protein [Phototrophicaceae bacterium]
MSARKSVDLQRIIQIAVTLADQEGFEAVTLAAVAAELGIRIPSLYNHVAGLPGLRYEIRLWGLRQLGDQIRRAAVGKAGEDAILNFARAYRTFAHTHPGVYPTTLAAATPDQPDLVAAAQEVLDILVAILEPYGFKDDDLLHAIRGLRSVLHGFVGLEISGGFGMPLDQDESFRRLMKMFIAGLQSPH